MGILIESIRFLFQTAIFPAALRDKDWCMSNSHSFRCSLLEKGMKLKQTGDKNKLVRV